MSKVNYITIKNKLSGFTRAVGEPEFNGMIDKADYEVIASKKSESSKPDGSWTNAKIMAYLDTKDIEYAKTDTKAVLLSKVD